MLPARRVPGDVLVEVVSCSRGGYEALALETVDFAAGAWVKADVVSSIAEQGGWSRSLFRFHADPVDATTLEQALARVNDLQRPSASLSSVELHTDAGKRTVLTERQPFAVRLAIDVNEDLEDLDVGIKFTRADGVYVFWQSTGLVGERIEAARGPMTVEFLFDENNLGAGDYALTAYVANGWDFPANYPYSEVYDRKVGCVQFKVMPSIAGLDMGMLNQRVGVRVWRGDAQASDVPAAAEVSR